MRNIFEILKQYPTPELWSPVFGVLSRVKATDTHICAVDGDGNLRYFTPEGFLDIPGCAGHSAREMLFPFELFYDLCSGDSDKAWRIYKDGCDELKNRTR